MTKKIVYTLACACVVWGCSKSEPDPDASAPESYMKDEAFVSQLKERAKERDSLLGKRIKLSEALEAEKAAAGVDSPRAKDLQKQLDACDDEFENHRKTTYKIVRERMMKDVKKVGGSK